MFDITDARCTLEVQSFLTLFILRLKRHNCVSARLVTFCVSSKVHRHKNLYKTAHGMLKKNRNNIGQAQMKCYGC